MYTYNIVPVELGARAANGNRVEFASSMGETILIDSNTKSSIVGTPVIDFDHFDEGAAEEFDRMQRWAALVNNA